MARTSMRSLLLRSAQAARRRTLCTAAAPSAPQPAAAIAPGSKLRIPLTVTALNEHGDGVGTYHEDGNDSATGVQVVVPFAAPGDQLQVEVWERDLRSRLHWAAGDADKRPWPTFGQQLALEQASTDRVEPLCSRYFGVCGGCKLQHVSYACQLQEKQSQVTKLFAQRRHSPEMEMRDILGVQVATDSSTELYHYRNKMEFTCSTGRWLLAADKPADDAQDTSAPDAATQFPFTVGMFPVASVSARRAKQLGGKKRKGRGRGRNAWSPRILSLDACLLQAPACNRVLQQLVQRCEDAGLAAYDFHSHEGLLKQLVLRRGVNGAGRTELMLVLATTTFQGQQSDLLREIVVDLLQEHEQELQQLGDDAARLVSVIQTVDDEAHRHRRARAMSDDAIEEQPKARVLFGREHLEDSILDHRFEISFDSFFQPNSTQASVLYREIRRFMTALPTKPVVWDLFCGVGSIGICLGAQAKRVVGFELVQGAVERAESNARLNGYSAQHMQFFCVDLAKNWREEELLERIAAAWGPDAACRPDVVIVDPPRAGLHRKLVQMLRRLAPKHVCYVSCNPRSQVADLETLCGHAKPEVGEFGSYRVRHLQPVDMLPHTPHLETIAWLERV